MQEYSVNVALNLTVRYESDEPQRPNDIREDVRTLTEGAEFRMSGVNAFVAEVDRVGRAS